MNALLVLRLIFSCGCDMTHEFIGMDMVYSRVVVQDSSTGRAALVTQKRVNRRSTATPKFSQASDIQSFLGDKGRPSGTLHFKLREITDDGTEDAPDEPQLRYLPQLNADRDQELIKILPNFLVDEIEFPRSHVDKFYARVVKALTGA